MSDKNEPQGKLHNFSAAGMSNLAPSGVGKSLQGMANLAPQPSSRPVTSQPASAAPAAQQGEK